MRKSFKLDSNETLREKARWKLLKNIACCLEKFWKQHPTKQQQYSHLPS